jgi:hypothetical protein
LADTGRLAIGQVATHRIGRFDDSIGIFPEFIDGYSSIAGPFIAGGRRKKRGFSVRRS